MIIRTVKSNIRMLATEVIVYVQVNSGMPDEMGITWFEPCTTDHHDKHEKALESAFDKIMIQLMRQLASGKNEELPEDTGLLGDRTTTT